MGVNIEGFSGVFTACLNAVFIVVFNAIYRAVAVQLTAWENHRTESAYENSLILKSFSFQFVNSYTSFFYIAFFRSQVIGLGLRLGFSPGLGLGLGFFCFGLGLGLGLGSHPSSARSGSPSSG